MSFSVDGGQTVPLFSASLLALVKGHHLLAPRLTEASTLSHTLTNTRRASVTRAELLLRLPPLSSFSHEAVLLRSKFTRLQGEKNARFRASAWMN